MLRNHDTVKAANFRWSKSKAKVIEWETQEHSWGIRDVPVEVTDMMSWPKLRKKASTRTRIENSTALQGETAPQPMDVDKTLWVEDPVIPTSEKRVRQPAFPSWMKLIWDMSPSPRTLTLKSSSLRLALTYTASSILRVSWQWLHAKAASLLHLSEDALTAFLRLFSARSAAKSHINCFLFTEFINGEESTSCHYSYGRLGCACNLGTLVIHAWIKWCAMKLFMF